MLESEHQKNSQLSKRLQDYLQSILHLQLDLVELDTEFRMPIFLTKEFEFLQADIASNRCLFAIVRNDSDLTPADLIKRQERLQRDVGGVVVFVFDRMSAYTRARLVEKGVSFIVPDNQLYIPSLAMDLREHFRARPSASSANLSPAAQVVLFRHLLLAGHDPWTPSGLAKDLRYSAMSIGRAFEELVTHGLAHVQSEGRNKHIVFSEDNGRLFELARPLLRSPVKSSHFFRAPPVPKGFHGTTLPQSFPFGGEMALSEQSMLNPPDHPHFAVGPKDWKTLQTGEFGPEVDYRSESNFSVDVWRYDPDIVVGEKKADPLSLYMQFQNHTDERVAGAATYLMEALPWFRE